MTAGELVTTTVTDLAVGQSGTIVDLTGTRIQRLKLLDLGLTPGTRVSVRKIAPLADPIEVEVRSYMLTLRKAEAGMITVVVDAAENAPADSADEASEAVALMEEAAEGADATAVEGAAAEKAAEASAAEGADAE